ncbi:disease resistance protein (TIR-NBS-LRR class), partial [Trifolium pratense]
NHYKNVDVALGRRQPDDKVHGNVFPNLIRDRKGLQGTIRQMSRNENEAIKDIVENVTRLLDKRDLFVANNPVGVKSRVKDITQLLDLNIQPSNDVILLGVWGMGGVGKTTMAKAIYNEIGRDFEGRSFLANIREVWEENARQVNLQEQLLSDIFKAMKIKLQNVEYGKIILKDKLRHRRVLIVLDDVNTLDQLNALCGSHQWFGLGSRIIITTRDRHLLRGNRVNKVYEMKHMDEKIGISVLVERSLVTIDDKKRLGMHDLLRDMGREIINV